MVLKIKKATLCKCKVASFEVWTYQRRERDSNPRRYYPQRFSRPPQSTTLPSLRGQKYKKNVCTQEKTAFNFYFIDASVMHSKPAIYRLTGESHRLFVIFQGIKNVPLPNRKIIFYVFRKFNSFYFVFVLNCYIVKWNGFDSIGGDPRLLIK